MAFDWAGLEQELHDGLVAAVTELARSRPGERLGAAALAHLYRETGGAIRLPSLGVATAAELAGTGWSPPDWESYDDEWLPDGRRWETALTEHAARHWQRAFDRYLTALVRACRRARATLRAAGTTDRDFVVLLLDDALFEPLITRVLPPGDVRRLFGEFGERAVALARLGALPPVERAAAYADLLDTFTGPVIAPDAEQGLRECGRAAWPALLPLLRPSGDAPTAARLLADIAEADDAVIDALRTALHTLDGPGQEWSARALSRLGRLDLVLDAPVPRDVVVTAIVAPYTAFADRAVTPKPLDYGPLIDVLEREPSYGPDLEDELKPGSSYRRITRADVPAAAAALRAPHRVVRWHAVGVLGERRLGAGAARLLVDVMNQDPDASVRRLAVLCLHDRVRDPRIADAVRGALDDPAPEVREAAAIALRPR